jgi:hypothetical protein
MTDEKEEELKRFLDIRGMLLCKCILKLSSGRPLLFIVHA